MSLPYALFRLPRFPRLTRGRVLLGVVLSLVFLVVWVNRFTLVGFAAPQTISRLARLTAFVGVVLIALLALSLVLYYLPLKQAGRFRDIQDKDRGQLENEYRKTLAHIIGGAAVLGGLYFTWQEVKSSQERQTTERYHWAVSQLGSETPVARLGGIYTLARIARESRSDQKEVVKILTSFIRYRRPLSTMGDTSLAGVSGCRGSPDAIPFDIQAALDVLRDRHSFLIPEGEEYLDLSRTDLRNANLSRIDLRKADLHGSRLEGAQLVAADLRKADLRGARLDAADLSESQLDWSRLNEVALCGATLAGAKLINADLSAADLTGAVLTGAGLSQATLLDTRLEEAVDISESQLKPALIFPSTLLPVEHRRLLPPADSGKTTTVLAPSRCGCGGSDTTDVVSASAPSPRSP